MEKKSRHGKKVEHGSWLERRVDRQTERERE
jgi:hypothetical protein